MATVPVPALKLYGNNAVFSTLPPSTLGQADTKVPITLEKPGRFTPGVAVAGDVAPSITMPPAVKDHATLSRYSAAFKEYQQIVVPPASSVPAVSPVDFATATAVAQMRTRANPAQTVPARLASMVSLGGQKIAWSGTELSNAFIAARLDLAFVETLRFLMPRTFDRVMAFPHLLFPLSRKLEKLAPEVFLPGVGVLPNDFIMAVKTNPRFVEALMLGANHEMGREMLWQGYPTDSAARRSSISGSASTARTTSSRSTNGLASPLGAQPSSTEMLVLLIRGQLLERFPNLSIYAYPLLASEIRPGGSSPPPPQGVVDPQEMDPAKVVLPVMRGHLNKDITLCRLSDPAGQHREVLLRDRGAHDRAALRFRRARSQRRAAGQHVAGRRLERGRRRCRQLLRQRHVEEREPRGTARGGCDPHAATVADALLQRPFRGFWKGQALKMPKP